MDVYRVVDSILFFLGPYRLFWIATGRERNNKETRYYSIRLFTPKLVPVRSISYIVYVVSKDFFTWEEISFFEKGFIDEPNYVRSKFRQKLEGEKKKNYERREIISNPDISVFRHNAFSVGCVACAHKLNAWVDKKFAIVETRPWKERVVNNGYTSMSRQRSGRHCQIGSFGSRFWSSFESSLPPTYISQLQFLTNPFIFIVRSFQLLEAQRTVLLAVYKLGTRSIILQPSSKYGRAEKVGQNPVRPLRVCPKYTSDYIPNVGFRDEQFRNFEFFILYSSYLSFI